MKPTYLVVNTTTAHTSVIDSIGVEYPTWLLLPEKRDFVSDTIRRTFSYERPLVEMASKIIRTGGAFVDVGAGLGGWTVQLAKLRPEATFYAFEAKRPLYLTLCANLLLNSLTRVTAREIEVGGSSWWSLDALLDGVRAIDAIRIACRSSDIAELVLKGAAQVLENTEAPVLLYAKRSPGLLSCCEKLGYELAELGHGALVLAPKKELRKVMRKLRA